MSTASACTTVVQPLGAPAKSTTMGPFAPAAALWMCAPVTPPIPDAASCQHTEFVPVLIWTEAEPVPSGSPGGTSLLPSRPAASGTSATMAPTSMPEVTTPITPSTPNVAVAAMAWRILDRFMMRTVLLANGPVDRL